MKRVRKFAVLLCAVLMLFVMSVPVHADVVGGGSSGSYQYYLNYKVTATYQNGKSLLTVKFWVTTNVIESVQYFEAKLDDNPYTFQSTSNFNTLGNTFAYIDNVPAGQHTIKLYLKTGSDVWNKTVTFYLETPPYGSGTVPAQGQVGFGTYTPGTADIPIALPIIGKELAR